MVDFEYLKQRIHSAIICIESRINSREWANKYSENTKGSNGIAILSSMGALAYLVSITIGSGSYKELMPEWVSQIFGYLLVLFLIVNLGFFLLTSLFVIESFLNLKTLQFETPRGLELSLKFFVKSVSLAFVLVVFFAATHALTRGVSEDFVNATALIVVILVASGFLALAILDTVRLVSAGSIIEIPAALSIFVLTSIICLNGFRDAQKSALIADSQYCYWIRSSVSTSRFTTTEEYNAALSNFNNRKPCKALVEKGIKLEALAVTR